MTADQQALAIQLRSEQGLSYVHIASKIGVSEKATYSFLKPLLIPKPLKLIPPKPLCEPPAVRKTLPAKLLPEHQLNRSCPMRRHINPEDRDAPQLTKSQMYYDLARAVRNTLRLARR
jgi:hypothetical protein